MMNGKKGIAPLILIAGVIGFLLIIYLVLFLPIPKFAEIRSIINYFAILIFWFAFQGLLIYGYYQLGKLFYKGFTTYKKKLLTITEKINNMIAN